MTYNRLHKLGFLTTKTENRHNQYQNQILIEMLFIVKAPSVSAFLSKVAITFFRFYQNVVEKHINDAAQQNSRFTAKYRFLYMLRLFLRPFVALLSHYLIIYMSCAVYEHKGRLLISDSKLLLIVLAHSIACILHTFSCICQPNGSCTRS